MKPISPAAASPLCSLGVCRCAKRAAGLLLATALLCSVAPTAAVTVISKTVNTVVHLGLSFEELEFENPLPAGAHVLSHPILEWLDADYSAGPPKWYDDWMVSHPEEMSGSPHVIWMLREGHRMWTTSSVPSALVSLHLSGDPNSGLAAVLVDGVEVARLNLNSPAGPHRAVVMVHSLPLTPHHIEVRALGPAPGTAADDVAVFGAAALGPSQVKWEQPPTPAEPANTFYGGDLQSMTGMPPLAADDWVCASPLPVTRVRWWGSFPGWREAYLPQPAPSAFQMAIWTDVPRGPNNPFSHPGQVIHLVNLHSFTVQWVGWVFDPSSRTYESCFLYEATLPRADWFHQAPGEGGTNIYWLSLSATYPPGAPGPTWGWHTRPRDPHSPAPDAAVIIHQPFNLTVGAQYVAGNPVHWPDESHWVDLAFELFSDQDLVQIKHDQPPELPPLGIDVNATFNPQGQPPMTNLLAEDFPCVQPGPLTHITVWASWRNDFFPGDPGQARIHVSIHTNIPAGPNDWSIPGPVLWLRSFEPGTYQVFPEFEGEEGWWDPPLPTGYIFPGDHLCLRYEFVIPRPEAFHQTGSATEPAIYWLDVQAEMPPTGIGPAAMGWKTSPVHWMDNAVWVRGREPYNGTAWRKLDYPPPHPKAGQPVSLAFRVGTSETITELKWSQPPEPFQPPDAFHGWNQPSVHGWTNVVADDWVCTNATPVTDIHWWGSFVNWGHRFPPELPAAFIISFWTDVPAGPLPFSHPGRVLHQVRCTNYVWEFVGWDFDPRDPTTPPEACFRFEQDLLGAEWFHQEPGTNIYWISIAAEYGPNQVREYPWGWKTRPRDPRSPAPDDAVNIRAPTAPVVGSQFIAGHRLEFPPGVSWDAAFVLTTRQLEPEVDYGDAPDSPYPTLAANQGPSHTIVPGVFLGALVDGEPDGQPNANATGDDQNPPFAPNDEDGVTFNGPLLPGHPASVKVVASVAGFCSLWVDFNGDGNWLTPGDQVFNAQGIPAGASTLSFTVPLTAAPTPQTFARARFCRAAAPIALPTGHAPDGEVEDYAVSIQRLDYGDAPDPTYPTLLVNNGARHIIVPFGPGVGLALGAWVDAENDGQPHPQALGDDLNPPLGLDDEDGVQFHSALMAGVPNTITVTTTGGGCLQGFFDLNADGDWNDPGEHVLVDRVMNPGPNAVTFFVSSLTNAPRTYARFRLSSQRGLGPTGLAPDGEVEDYEIPLRPLKWLQPPEVGWEGVDVNNVHNLADDFLCLESGAITDLHIWGSFRADLLPPGGPTNMGFVLTIFADVPAGPNQPYSRPGEPLWTRVYQPGSFTAALATPTSGEWWHDPNPPVWLYPGDTNIYQFDFRVPRSEAFLQVNGTIYWLSVKHINPGPGNYDFGWKTTYQAWNDAACWFDLSVNQWRPLRYQSPHPRTGNLDFAFALGNTAAAVLDFGDAPDPTYPTLLANDGARHAIVPGLRLGSLVDAEPDGQPDPNALGDDNNPTGGPVDEDGVLFANLAPGYTALAAVTVTGQGLLSAWLDFGSDGSWAESGDQIFADVPLTTGSHLLSFAVPTNVPWGATTFARFRYSTAANLSFTGAAPDGEVEDHLVQIQPRPNSDLGDAPDSSNHSGASMTAYPKGGPPGVLATFPTVRVSSGAPFGPIHANARVVLLGNAVTGEHEADIFGDEDFVNNLDPVRDRPDQDGADDGLLTPVLLPHCRPGKLLIQVNGAGPVPMLLNVWCDWNRDGDWNDILTCPDGTPAPEWAVQNIPAPPGTSILSVPIQAWHRSLAKQPIWVRITLADIPTPGPLGFSGLAGGDGPSFGYQFGETEDYYLTDYDDDLAFDFGDAPDPPYPTLLPTGARHGWVPGFALGLLVDPEPNGQPTPGATGDDPNPPGANDEDGVALPVLLRRGAVATVNVTLTSGPLGGRLDAWADFNRDGVWASLTPEHIASNLPLTPGPNPLIITVPSSAKLGPTYARFRLSSVGGLPPEDPWLDGEVEDHVVTICQRRPTLPVQFTGIMATNTVIGGQKYIVSTLSWTAETGIEYQLQATHSLSNAPACTWMDIGAPIVGPVNSLTETNLAPVERYYRLVVPYVCP